MTNTCHKDYHEDTPRDRTTNQIVEFYTKNFFVLKASPLAAASIINLEDRRFHITYIFVNIYTHTFSRIYTNLLVAMLNYCYVLPK